VTIAEIALNAPITDLDHAEASDRKRVSCFHGSAPLSAETAPPSDAHAHDRLWHLAAVQVAPSFFRRWG
jgi:hypothetical protein